MNGGHCHIKAARYHWQNKDKGFPYIMCRSSSCCCPVCGDIVCGRYLGITTLTVMIGLRTLRRGFVLIAGRLTTGPIFVVFCMMLLLSLVGCSSSQFSSPGRYSGSVYTVKRGDTLYRIARMTGSSVSELARLNNIPSPYTLAVGQQLKVKAGGDASTTTGKSRTKTAKATPSYKVPASSGCQLGSVVDDGQPEERLSCLTHWRKVAIKGLISPEPADSLSSFR